MACFLAERGLSRFATKPGCDLFEERTYCSVGADHAPVQHVELTQQIGRVTHVASREPVIITQHRKPRFVLMSFEGYERWRTRGDTRSVGMLETMPEELLEEAKVELARYEREGANS